MAMDAADNPVEGEQAGRKDMKDEDEISTECLLKEGTVTEEDINCILRDIADSPEDVRELLEILGIDGDDQSIHDVGLDTTDGAPISSCILPSYVGLIAALDNSSLKRRDLVVKQCLINKDPIPTCILARGKKALEAYRRALKSGKTYDNRVKVVLIGQDRAGKTSVARALRGEALQKDEPRTDGVQMNEPLKNATEAPWRYSSRKSSAYEEKCVEIMHRALLEESTDQLAEQVTKDARENVAFEAAVNRNAVESEQPDPAHVDGNCMTSLTVTGKNDVEAVPDEIATLLEERLDYDQVDTSEEIWPVIWELAGQAVDRAIHPIFMSSEAVYLLVLDLTNDVYAKTARCNDSSLDNIMRCMDTVHSLKQSTKDETFPPVIVVGTHADCVKRDDLEEKVKCLSVYPLIDEHVVGHVAVDNTQAGKNAGDEDPEIVCLRQKILRVAKTMPSTKKEIPLHWFYIESKVEEKARGGENYVSKETFKQDIVEKVCTPEEAEDIEQILHFLHDRGTVVYHDRTNKPDGLVVLDPQWLISVIRQILNVESSREDSMKVYNYRKQLRDRGILATQLLDHACKTLGVLEIKQSLVFIMEKFNLLFSCHGKDNQNEYLVPCLLTSKSDEDEDEAMIPGALKDDSSPALYLTFKTDYVPVGLFPKLVDLFGAWAASKTSCEQQKIFSDEACFILDDKTFLQLMCHKSVIKLKVWSRDDLYGDVRSGCHSEINSYLERSLEIIQKEYHWLRSISWELSFRCTLCTGKSDPETGRCIWHGKTGCLHDDCAHYMPLNTRPYFCSHAKGLDRVLSEERFEVWLRAVGNNNIQKKTTPAVQSTLMPFKQDKSKVQVTLLSGEWGSSKGGLPTVNRLLAIELAKNPQLEVTLYVANCSEEDKRMANNHGVTVIKAEKRPGFEDLDCLCFRPHEEFLIDVVIGHGMKLGKQAQLIKQFYPRCAWIQFEHTAPEELAMYKKYSCCISKGEEKHQTEVQLSAMADLVVAIGPKLAEAYRIYLRPYPEKRVFELTPSPSIFTEFNKCKQAEEDREKFNVLVFGRGDEEDFELKGYDIAPKAIAELRDLTYHLYFVGAVNGQMEKVTERLLKYGISKSQLTVRGFIESRERLANQLCEVDLAIMPSRTEGFGLTALEALSAGLPILVGENSGFAETLKGLKKDNSIASSCIVHSKDGKDWAAAIRAVKEKPRSQRLEDVHILKACYEKTYNCRKRCNSLAREVLALGLRGKRDSGRDTSDQNEEEASDAKDSKKGEDTEDNKEKAIAMTSETPQLSETSIRKRTTRGDQNHDMTARRERKEKLKEWNVRLITKLALSALAALVLVLVAYSKNFQCF